MTDERQRLEVRVGDWMQTFTGRRAYPFDMRVEEICIEDIAHALALTARYNGHSLRFYSVAQHSVHVSYLCAREDALWGLMHDAAEAYLGDIIRPIKRAWPEFCKLEDRVLAVIASRFELMGDIPDSVHVADNVALATEQRDLMAPPPSDWYLTQKPHHAKILPQGPIEAERRFLHRFRELCPLN